MKVFSLHGDEWDRTENRPGWRSKDAWVVKGERILLSRPGPELHYWEGEE